MRSQLGMFANNCIKVTLTAGLIGFAALPSGFAYAADLALQEDAPVAQEELTASVGDQNVALGQSFAVALNIPAGFGTGLSCRVNAYDGGSEVFLPLVLAGDTLEANATTVSVATGASNILVSTAALKKTGSDKPFVVHVYDSNGVELGKSILTMNVLEASADLSFDACVPSGDLDPLDSESIAALSAGMKVTYGRAYSYDPSSSAEGRALPQPTRPNYIFDGWYSSYDAKTGAYAGKVDEKSTVAATGKSTLYAKWRGVDCTVYLNVGKGKAADADGNPVSKLTFEYGTTYAALADLVLTGTDPDNSEFYGWTTLDNNGDSVDIEPGTRVNRSTYWSDDKTQTLTAEWGIKRASIEGAATVTGLEESYPYTGAAIEPKITVTMPAPDNPARIITLIKDVDYVISYENNTAVSTADKPAMLTIKGMGAYKGSISKSFSITKGVPAFEKGDFTVKTRSYEENRLITDAKNVTYTSSDESVAVVTSAGIVAGVRPGKVTITAVAPATDSYEATPKGGLSYTLTVKETNLSKGKMTLSGTKFAYTGKVRRPTVKVVDAGGAKLKLGTDFVAGYTSGCKKVGTYNVTIIGINGYSGWLSKNFAIIPKAPSSFKKKKMSTTYVSGKKTAFYKLSWKKVSKASGYQIKRVYNGKTKTTTFSSKASSQVFGWISGKKVKASIRTYQKVDGKRYYSAWKTISLKA